MVKQKNKRNNSRKNNAFTAYRNTSSNTAVKNCLKNLQVCFLNTSIECAKVKYYRKIANKLNNTRKTAKAYWSFMKISLHDKKIPLSFLHYITIVVS